MSETGTSAEDLSHGATTDEESKDKSESEVVAPVENTAEPVVEKRDEPRHDAFFSPAPFDNIKKALEGQVVLVQPRVSRETIIDVLREHTDMIRQLRAEYNSTRSSVHHLLRLTESQGNDIRDLQSDMTKAKEDIVVLEASSAEFKSELDRIKETLGEISNIKREMQMQRESIQDINNNIAGYKVEVKENFDSVDRSLQAMDSMNRETQFILKELREYVEHFGDNLILASTQITVESKVGFADRPMSLQDILKMLNKSLNGMGTTLTEHTNQICDNTATILTKADATIAVQVTDVEKRVDGIEYHLKQEAESGINALRKLTEDLSTSVEHIITDLGDKVDRKSVDLIVHNKYEDIVEYLQQALHSADEDGDGARQKAEDMDAAMKKLAVVKADKTELRSIQEALVKVEASFSKISRAVGENKDNYSKKEIEQLLQNKIDREELSVQLKELTRSMRKSHKAAVTSGGIMVTDDGNYADPAMSRTMSAIELAQAKSSGMKPITVPKVRPQQQNQRNFSPSVGDDDKLTHGTYTFPDEKQLNVRPGNNVSENNVLSGNPEYNVIHGASTEGWNLGAPSLHAIEPMLTSSGVPGGHGQDMSVLGAPTFGGGYNTKKKIGAHNHDRPGLKALGEVDPDTPDLEGGGMMVTGTDGKKYYSDRPNADDEDLHPSTPVPKIDTHSIRRDD